eukprot:CAMPEP_0196744032 /NCGR_PEP_ID=MMETSP1091-20130531/55617_1 /TAXON_ID=302021 /ORGANISM="Rhodomonas sp., Strain CCMP768" /LENGTH=36 /DNA_ID= /DNA_START= /DNA_END= /DNA_ORIENTATION=
MAAVFEGMGARSGCARVMLLLLAHVALPLFMLLLVD